MPPRKALTPGVKTGTALSSRKRPASSSTKREPPIRVPLTQDYPEVFFDQETSGLLSTPEITQMAAVGPNGIFNKYIKPKKSIQPKSSTHTGLSYVNGQMYLHGAPVESVSLDECLQELMIYLGKERCTLVSHNARSFDSVVLVRAVLSAKLWQQFEARVAGFLDTLPLFRREYPDLPSKHGQAALVKHFLGQEYRSQDSLKDVLSLKELLDHCNFSADKKRPHTFSIKYAKKKLKHSEQKKKENLSYAEQPKRIKREGDGWMNNAWYLPILGLVIALWFMFIK